MQESTENILDSINHSSMKDAITILSSILTYNQEQISFKTTER